MRRSIFLAGALFAISSSVFAQDVLLSFTDVPETREDFSAIENLRMRGIVEGRPDGSFGPDDLVNRAEAVTIIVRAVANIRNLPPLVDCFPDVRGKDWYIHPVCYAKDLEWIGGYPDGTFQPTRTVSDIEFLKILLSAYGTDLESPEARNDPLAPDVYDPLQWYFPYLAYAMKSAMIFPDASGNLHPGTSLTRGTVALLMDRFLLYREGQRNDTLVGEASRSIQRTLDLLDLGDTMLAGFAAAHARLLAEGAAERLPEEALVRAIVLISEAVTTLLHSHRALPGEDVPEALRLAQKAYRQAEEAVFMSREIQMFADRIRTMAHDRAEELRSRGSIDNLP